MNITNFYHALLAISVQGFYALVAVLLGRPALQGLIAGGLLAIGFYLGREVAQAERKIKASNPNAPWYCGFDMSKWSTDSVWDLFMPVLAVLIVCLIWAGIS